MYILYKQTHQGQSLEFFGVFSRFEVHTTHTHYIYTRQVMQLKSTDQRKKNIFFVFSQNWCVFRLFQIDVDDNDDDNNDSFSIRFSWNTDSGGGCFVAVSIFGSHQSNRDEDDQIEVKPVSLDNEAECIK